MGYTTEFTGKFEINKVMPREFVEYINRFSSTRRMKRDNDKIKKVHPNWKELCFNGNLGVQGEYLAIKSNKFGQEQEASIVDYNRQPCTQPGLWCQWVIETNEDLKDETIDSFTGSLVWDNGEKFYEYVDWLAYMIKHFFEPSELVLNGIVLAVGEEVSEDATYILVKDNRIFTQNAHEENAIEEVINTIGDNSSILAIFEGIKKTSEEILDEYGYDEYDD